MTSRRILLIGFVLVLAGAVLPWLTVLQIIPSNFAILFFSFGASLVGVFLGIIGAAWYTMEHRKRN